jgi:signal transduction histidine kinase/ActR/RegA family two-component response regulator
LSIQLQTSSQARLSRVLNAARAMVWQWDPSTRQITHEVPQQLWMQTPLRAPLGVRAALRLVHADDRGEVLARARTAIERRTPYVQHIRMMLGDPPAPVWLEHHGTVICDDRGDVTCLEGILIDITPHRQALDALALADRRKDEFFATLAHELRNPLTAIAAAAQALSTSLLDTSGTRICIEMIRRQAAQLSRLADDLLDLSHVVRDRLTLKRERVDLIETVKTAVEATQEALKARRHNLQLVLPPARFELDADPVRLIQLFGNLLTNAIKYTPDAGTIGISVEREGSSVRVHVRDSGIGIGSEHLPHLFEPFYRANNSLVRTEGGLGIGLALALRIALLHGGSIDVHSTGHGKGSEFVVRLPLLSEEQSRAAGSKGPERVAPLPARSEHPLHILVADDNADVAEALALSLRMSGHEVHVALDGEAALALADKFQPQVALLDITMPKRGGHEVGSEIRARAWAAHRGVFLVALTGWNTRDLGTRIDMSVFDTQIVKPPDIEAIRRLVEERAAIAAQSRAVSSPVGH